MVLRVGVLGPVTAWFGDQELPVGQPRQQAVLGILAMRANRVISRGELVDAVWGQDPPASAEGGIYTYVAGLRRIIEPNRSLRGPGRVLVSSGAGYVLHLVPGSAGRRLLRAVSDPGAPVAQERRSSWRGDRPELRAWAVARDRLRRGAWTVRGNRADPPQRAAFGRCGRTGRRPARAGPARGGRARPDGHGDRSSAPGADARPADDRAVPRWTARRGAPGVHRGQARAGRGTRHRPRQRTEPHSPADPDRRYRA